MILFKLLGKRMPRYGVLCFCVFIPKEGGLNGMPDDGQFRRGPL